MNEAEIKLKRVESILVELIPEALSNLNDERLHGLSVVEVKSSRGRSDAKVYLDPAHFSESEKALYLKQLKKARAVLEDYCLKEQGWFRSPKLTFEFDNMIAKVKTIDELFKQISKERE